MKNLFTKLFIISILFLGFTAYAQAASPVLNFSDIISGPSSGLGDGVGEGAIVTIWGNNLGSSQGSSVITIGGQSPAHIYYWKNADGNGASSAVDLYSKHKMQEIAFSIPNTLANGNYNIEVTVDGVTSNTLPFTVRSGNIYFVTPTGNGDGSFGNPFSPNEYLDILSGGEDGAIAYFRDGTYNSNYKGNGWHTNFLMTNNYSGTITHPNAFISYPGNHPLLSMAGAADRNNVRCSGTPAQYIVFAKFDTYAQRGSLDSYTGWRLVGNHVNAIHEQSGSGSIGTGLYQDNSVHHVSIFGNEIMGGTSGNKLDHAIYPGSGINYLYVGWNYVHDNNFGNGPMLSFNCNQAWEENLTSRDIYFYNNYIDVTTYPSRAIGVFETGENSELFYFNNVVNGGMALNGGGSVYAASGNLHYWNNTLYNTGGGGNVSASLFFYCMDIYGHTYCPDGLDLKNNIIYSDTPAHSRYYIRNATTNGLNIQNNNNLWYGLGDFTSISNQNVTLGPDSINNQNPLFVTNTDFQLQSASVARDAGMTIPEVLRDMNSAARPQGSAYDIGAYEYVDGSSAQIRADVDQNGTVNTTDAMLTLRNSLGLDMSGTNWHASSTTGDVNCDGSSNSTDAMLILRKSLGLDMTGTGWCAG